MYHIIYRFEPWNYSATIYHAIHLPWTQTEVYRGNSSSVIVEATAEGTMYNGCHNDIRLSIDYTNIEILHVVKHTAVVTT